MGEMGDRPLRPRFPVCDLRHQHALGTLFTSRWRQSAGDVGVAAAWPAGGGLVDVDVIRALDPGPDRGQETSIARRLRRVVAAGDPLCGEPWRQ